MRPGRWLLLPLAVAAGCNRTAPAPPPPAGQPADPTAVTVKVASPARQTLRWTIEQPATLQAYESTPVVAKLPGYVKSIAPDAAAREKGHTDAVIDMGSAVKAGQLLATLDIPELTEEAAQKRAAVEQAAAELEQSRKELVVSEAQVTAAKSLVQEAQAGVAKAAADLDRWQTELVQSEELVAKRVIDAQSRDVVRKQFQTAEAAKQEAVARVNSAAAALAEREARQQKAAAEVASAAARVKVAEADARRVEALVGYTAVKAPFDGIVTARHVHTGHFLQPSTGGRAETLFTVARVDPVRVFVDVPEAAAEKAAPGAAATVRVPALGKREFAGTVARTAGVIQPDSRTLRAEIDLPNPDGLLRPGMYAIVQIKAESADAGVLPAAAILPADETHYCYAVEDGKAVKLRVQTGRVENGLVQVLGKRRATATAGGWQPLAGTERVVVGNLGALTDGAAVKVAE